MNRTAIPFRRLWRPVAVVSSPAVAVLVILAALGQIGAGPAIVGVIVAVIGIGFIVRTALIDLAALRDYLAAVGQDPESVRPRIAFSDVLLPLLAGIRQLGRAAQAAGQGGRAASDMSGLDRLSDPVLMIGTDRRVIRANLAARDLLGNNLAGRPLAQVLRTPAVLEAVEALLDGSAEPEGDGRAEVDFAFKVPVERHFSARIARLPAVAADGTALVIALYDLTAVIRAEQMRTDFIANASHELRTPISVILGCVQTLGGSARDDPEAQAEFFGLMEAQAQRMSRLVDDLLALSRIELNEHTHPTERVVADEIVTRTADSLARKAEERGITVRTDLADGVQEIQGDKEDLGMAVQNLIDNAIKYAAENSTVTVSTRIVREGLPASLAGGTDHLAIAVSDQGDGIAPEHLPRLTERFYRVDTARSRQMGGTGLGLAIVKHVVNRHRGALTIDSTPGEGSVFTIWLPVGPRAPKKEGENAA